MAKQVINIGTTPNDDTGDTLRDAFDKANDNFTELYGGVTSYAGCGMEANATATTIGTAGTYVKVAGTSVVNTLNDFTHSAGALTYTGTDTKYFRVVANPISMISAGNNIIAACKIAKNGSVVGYPMTRKISTGSDVGAGAVSFDVELATSDYIELFVTNETDTSTVTVEDFYLSVTQIN